MIDLCTLTGIDSKTDLSRVADLSAEFPFLEFGVLLSRSLGDKDSRYLDFQSIERIVHTLSGKTKLALHVCGRAVKEYVAGAADIDGLVNAGVGRVQLNFSLPQMPFSMADLDGAISASPVPVITQHFPPNEGLAEGIKSENHHVLFDLSGGRGIAASTYLEPFKGKYTGYAGGLGPDNLAASMRSVLAVSKFQSVWIDMENRIRTDGYLDLVKCEKVASIAAGSVAAR